MGIHGLTKLLADVAPGCLREEKFANYFGRKLAVDASMSIYQFLVVVGRIGDQLLTSEAGEVTSHLQGMFFRTAKMLETGAKRIVDKAKKNAESLVRFAEHAGMKPLYVFDGAPPQLKQEQLNMRLHKRGQAEAQLAEGKDTLDNKSLEKYSKRTVKVTKTHNDECRRLLTLMGVPVIDAPSEAEAQCAALAKADVVYGVASEDMDALTFGTPRLIRHLMAPSAAAQQAIMEFDRTKMLEGLKLTNEQFIDVCILCGCDYCPNIRGIGPVRALQLIQKHGTIEKVLDNLDEAKYPRPEPFRYKEARELFLAPSVIPVSELENLKWKLPDEEGIVEFLVNEKSFNEDRIRKAVQRITAAKGRATQGRLDGFFNVTPKKEHLKPSSIVQAAPKKLNRPNKPMVSGPVKKMRLN